LHCAVDDGKGRLEELDISGRFPDEVWNLEGVANMQNVNALRPLRGGSKIHPDRVVKSGSKFKNRLSDLAETYNYNGFTLLHFGTSVFLIQRMRRIGGGEKVAGTSLKRERGPLN